MFIIEARTMKSRWISCIFNDKDVAVSYLNEISANLRQYHRLYRVNVDFPFYILENDGFEYVDEQGLVTKLNGLERHNEDSDTIYLNVYRIESDYRPPEPGMDFMGMLKHDHVTNNFLDWFEREGEGFLRRRGLV